MVLVPDKEAPFEAHVGTVAADACDKPAAVIGAGVVDDVGEGP
jgi:hypothetical protein